MTFSSLIITEKFFMRLNPLKGLSKEELSSPVADYLIPVETAFHCDLAIKDLLVLLHKKKIVHEIRYFYSIDEENKLCGVIATRDILFSDPEIKLSDISNTKVIR